MTAPLPDQLLAFLTAAQPGGIWHLSALGPRPSDTLHAAFHPAQSDLLKTWITEQQNRGADLYFRAALAKTCTGKGGALEDADVTAVSVLWCDIDVQAVKKITSMADRTRVKAGVLSHIKQKLGNFIPSFINDSGNGFHLYWKLYQPLTVGVGFSHTDLSTYLYGIAKWLGGDGKCRNPSRLLRLPGTYNIKNPALPLLCHTVETNNVEYSISDFEQYRDDSFLSRTPTEILEIEPAADVDIEKLNLPADLLTKITTGINPKTGLKWSDRSQLMNHVAVEMVKLGLDPAIILAVIMDGRYLHAGHVWESREPLREGRRTLNWALNAGADDAVSRLNRNYFMVCLGGKIVYGKDDNESQVPVEPREIIAKGDFLTEIAPFKETTTVVNEKTGKSEEVEINVYKKWVEDAHRRRFYPKGYIIDPTRTHSDGYYNLWKGFAVQSNPHPWPMTREVIRCLCEGRKDYIEYVMNWAAMTVQQPTILPRTALIFHGDQGTGKTLFASSLAHLFGIHAMKITKPEQLVGRFTGHLDCKIFMHLDDVHFNQSGVDALKSLVSDDKMPVERKGGQIFQTVNYSHICIASNYDTVLPVEPGNRRFVIFEPLKEHKGDKEFWSATIDELKHGGYEGMLYSLQQRDIRGWDAEFNRPETLSMTKHKQSTLSNARRTVQAWLEAGDYSQIALAQAEERYRPNKREVDEILVEMGIVRDHTGVQMPKDREAMELAWEKLIGIRLKRKK